MGCREFAETNKQTGGRNRVSIGDNGKRAAASLHRP